MHERDAPPAPAPEGTFKRKAITAAVVVVGVLLGWWIVAATVPRWWAQRMGNVIDGRLTYGTFVGVVVGAIFAILPMLVLWLGWKWRRGWRDGGWKRFAVFVALAALLATPNLATLGIVFGNGNAAHAGERILDVDGPGFRGGSLVGALLGALAVGGVMWLASSRRRNKRKADQYRRDLRERPPAEPQPG